MENQKIGGSNMAYSQDNFQNEDDIWRLPYLDLNILRIKIES
jgi:hypothetical protein